MIKKKVFLFIGTTAELIKLVPIIQVLNSHKVKYTIIASGQNDIHFEEFATKIGNPTILYAVTPKGKDSSVIKFFIWSLRSYFSLMKGLRGYFNELNKSNCYFIVHGDTVSSLIGSIVARYYGLNLVHIESGLRSFNFFEPFPEEICRYIISKLADIHFCPNEWSLNNLTSINKHKINTYENTLIEAFWQAKAIKSHHSLNLLLEKQKKHYFVLVTHRQEHVLFGKKKTAKILKYILETVPESLQCVFLVHDLSANFIHELGSTISEKLSRQMIRIDRLPYVDFMYLISKSEFVITDGGSNQEEMYYMGKPCLLLRNTSERIEGLGKNVVLSKNNRHRISSFIRNYKKLTRTPVPLPKLKPSHIIYKYLFK